MTLPDQSAKVEESGAGNQVDHLVSVFIDACRQGQRPNLEAFLPADPAKRWAALVELVRAELEWRLLSREAVRVEEYLERFPELNRDAQEVLALLAAEFHLRRRDDPQLPLDGYCRRFPQLAAELPVYLNAALESPTEAMPTHSEPSTYRTGPIPFAVDNEPHGCDLDHSQMLGYQIQAELGRGGMGIVYRAYDPRRQQVVALKTLQWMDPSALYRFKQEFRILADVTHPNLVSLYELVSDGRKWFFTMELVEGVDFQTYVRGGRQDACHAEGLSPAQLERLRQALRQLALGIEALHAAGKLHRDIKHRNVLVTPEGRVVLLDFGVSADLGQSGLHHSTQPHLLGTVTYMSPEQAAGRPVSTATDWYSVGVMLYEVLTGRLPFSGRPLEVLQQKQTADPAPPAALVAQIPDDLNQLCVDLLRRDPQARPSARQVIERLAGVSSDPRASTPPVQPRLSPSTFIGRAKELATLEEAYSAMLRGQPVTALVHGSSGSGKTGLVQAFLEAAGTRGAVILAGRCYEQEFVPYKAIDSLIDVLSKHLSRLPLEEARALLPRGVSALVRVFPVLGRAEAIAGASGRPVDIPDPQELRRKAFGALRELLARIGDRSPLVLFIDDLQWGDLDSAGLVAELLRPPDAPALLLVGCYRSDDAQTSPFLIALGTARKRSSSNENFEIPLEPMPWKDSLRLAKSLLEGEESLAQEHATLVAKESGGNPFFIYELVQHLNSGIAIDRDAKLRGELVLEQVLADRIASLPEQARDLLEVIAVAGRPLKLEDALKAAGLDRDQRSQVAALRAGRFVRASGGVLGLDAIESYHDRIRQSIVNSLPTPRLRQRHRCLAEALESSGDSDPEAMAAHFEQAGEPARAAKYFAVAADLARNSLAFDRAASLYRRVLALRQYVNRDQHQLQIELADALANAGRGADAAREYCEAAKSVDQPQSLELQQRAALQYLVSGRYAEGAAILRKVSKAAGIHFPPSQRDAMARWLLRRLYLSLRGLNFVTRSGTAVPVAVLRKIDMCWSAVIGCSFNDNIRSAYFQSMHLALALNAGEPYRLARALALEAAHESALGTRRSRRSAMLIQRAEECASRSPTPHGTALVTAVKGVVAALEGRWKQCLASCDVADEILRNECTGVVWERDTMWRFRLWSYVFMGNLSAASCQVPFLLKEAKERDDLYAVGNLATLVMPTLHLAADDPLRAREDLSAAIGPPEPAYLVDHFTCLYSHAQIDLYSGNGAAGLARVAGDWPLLRDAFLLRVQQVRILMRHLRARCALASATSASDSGGLMRVAARDAHRLMKENARWAAAFGTLIRAAVEFSSGGKDAARHLLSEAVGEFEAVDMHLYAAVARRRLGQLTAGAEGQASVDKADAWMAGQGIRNPQRMTAMLAPGFPD